MRRLGFIAALMALVVCGVFAQQQPAQPQSRPQSAQPARDVQRQPPSATASIGGRVLAADTGRPLKRASVLASGGGRQARGATTDDLGRFRVTGLPAGTYTITASKSGFVDAIFGQRRPLQPGTPVQLADGQETSGIDLRLTRGSVITGHVLDEDGEPLARALVTVQRYQYVRGERQLTSAGGDQTDDRGQYRVFGLPPGDYYVSATAGGLAQILGRGFQFAAGALAGAGRGGRGAFFGGPPVEDAEPVGYAPTYYPGVTSAADATKVTVAPGQELGGIDFQVQLVAMSTVSGTVIGSSGPVPVMLVPQDRGGVFRRQVLRAGSQADGSFAIANVPPGHYTAIARSGGRGEDPRIGTQAVTVAGDNVTGISIALQPGVSLAGYITVESSGTPAPVDYSGFRVDAPDVDPLPFVGGGPNTSCSRAEKNGAFQINGLLPGRHYIRVNGQGSWSLQSVSVAGRDVTDEPVDLKSGQNVDSVSIVLTDRSTQVTGTVRDAEGNPVQQITVIAFSADQQYWHSQSRQIQAVRVDQSGVFHLRGLPPGDYSVAAVDDAEEGEWFDPSYLEGIRTGAKRLSLSEGESATLDLKAPS
jgi:protocatechuate 3,4-dioxygenase beta subunit